MPDAELAAKIAEIDSRSKSNTHRIDKMEAETKAIHELAKSVAVMANQQQTMTEKLDEVAVEVREIKAEPAKRWRFVIEKIIYFIVAGVMGYMLSKIGLQ